MIRGRLPPSDFEMYQIHIPWRSNGLLSAGSATIPAGGSTISPAPPISAEAAEGMEATIRTERIARSARPGPGTGLRLTLTTIRNTVPLARLRCGESRLAAQDPLQKGP